jgi:hypothetical protein
MHFRDCAVQNETAPGATPEQVAEVIVPMCAPEWNETDKSFRLQGAHADELSAAGATAMALAPHLLHCIVRFV